MEPCVDVSQTEATCYSPPPVFDVPKPIWCLEPTTVGPPSTEEPTTVITETTTSWISSAISSTISSTTSVFKTTQEPTTTAHTTVTEPTEAPFFTTETPEPVEPTEGPSVHIAVIVVPSVVIPILFIILIILCWKKHQKEKERQEIEARMSYNSQKSTVGLVKASDEVDGPEKTTPQQKETFSYKNEEISLTENENGAPPKDEKGAEEKMAPIIPVTEL